MEAMEINFTFTKSHKYYVPNDWNRIFYLWNKVNGKYALIECRFKEIVLKKSVNSSYLSDIIYKVETPIGIFSVSDSMMYNYIYTEPTEPHLGRGMAFLLKYGKYISIESILSNGEIYTSMDNGYTYYQHKFYVWDGVRAISKYRSTECGYLTYRDGILDEHLVPLKDGEYLTKEECEEKNSINVIRFGKSSEKKAKKTYSVTLGENSSIEVDEDTYKNLMKTLMGSKEG